MPITVACPECSSKLNAPDNAVGRKVKCPKCGSAFAINAPAGNGPSSAGVRASKPAPAPPAPSTRKGPPPDEDDAANRPRRRRIERDEEEEDDRPRPRRRSRGSTSNAGLQMGLGVAALCVGIIGLILAFIPCIGFFALPVSGIGLILGLVGVVVAIVRKEGLGFPIAGTSVSAAGLVVVAVWFFVIASWVHTGTTAAREMQKDLIAINNQNLENMRRAQEEALKNQNKGGDPAPPQGQATPLNLQNGSVQVHHTLHNTDPRDRVNPAAACKYYTVAMTAGKTYQINMTSTQVDSYLRLEDSNGKMLAQDDDGGGYPNARIVFPCPETGTYRITATTFNAGLGRYTLRVQELQNANPNPIPNPPPGPGPAAPATPLTLAGGQTLVNGTLAPTDARDKIRGASVCKVYTLDLTAGKTYQIEMTSNQVDSYLRLEDPAGATVAQDDDGGGFPNARIIFPCRQAGQYRIVATTFIGGVGNFTLQVREQ